MSDLVIFVVVCVPVFVGMAVAAAVFVYAAWKDLHG